ncbi:2-oxoglutarate and iron-dependent oxygenase domain-containing protein [Arthrobacter oryzae]|uniref:2-oxoglutarate and iron-dependent oxygenase domain-containing protein n=1 Tax=Arthrobacter oryzae TaxID=409290 RepID=UPI0030C8FD7A
MPLERLPVVDFSRLNAGAEEASRFRVGLRNAMHEVGFQYLAGHGIPQERWLDAIVAFGGDRPCRRKAGRCRR